MGGGFFFGWDLESEFSGGYRLQEKKERDSFWDREGVFRERLVTGGQRISGEFFSFAGKEAFEVWTLLIILTILLRDIFVCFFV